MIGPRRKPKQVAMHHESPQYSPCCTPHCLERLLPLQQSTNSRWSRFPFKLQMRRDIFVHFGVLMHLQCCSMIGALQAGQTSVSAAEQRRILDRLRNQADSMRERLEEVGRDRAALRQEVISFIILSV